MANIENKLVYRVFDSVGDLTGTKNFIGDYSGGGSVKAIFVPEPGRDTIITGLRVVIDGGQNPKGDKYGKNNPLVVGLTLQTETLGGTLINSLETTGGFSKILTNSDFANWHFDVTNTFYSGGSSTLITADTNQAFLNVQYLLRDDERLAWVLNDNFTDLDTHKFIATGYSCPKNIVVYGARLR